MKSSDFVDPLDELQATAADIKRGDIYDQRMRDRRSVPVPWRLRGDSHEFRIRVVNTRWLPHIARLAPIQRGDALIEYLEKPPPFEDKPRRTTA